MLKSLLISCVLIFGLASSASAKEFRVLKGQQRDIAQFRRALSRGTLHPQAKKRVLKMVDSAERALLRSKADYKRVHTRVNKYGGTLVFAPAWGRDVRIHFNAPGNSRVQSVEVFKSHSNHSRTAFKAKALSSALTMETRARYVPESSNSPSKETVDYRLYSPERQRSTSLTVKLGELLSGIHTKSAQGKRLVSELEPIMSQSAPKGLKVVTRRQRVWKLKLEHVLSPAIAIDSQ